MKPDFIVFTGPECSGKSSISQEICRQYELPLVNELARTYIDHLNRPYLEADLDLIATEQIAEEKKKVKFPVICDTDLLTIFIWKIEVFDTIDLKMANQIYSFKNRFYLLCKPNIPWIYDAQRENEHDRDRLFNLYSWWLNDFSLPFKILDEPHFGSRFSQCLSIINPYL